MGGGQLQGALQVGVSRHEAESDLARACRAERERIWQERAANMVKMDCDSSPLTTEESHWSSRPSELPEKTFNTPGLVLPLPQHYSSLPHRALAAEARPESLQLHGLSLDSHTRAWENALPRWRASLQTAAGGPFGFAEGPRDVSGSILHMHGAASVEDGGFGRLPFRAVSLPCHSRREAGQTDEMQAMQGMKGDARGYVLYCPSSGAV